MSTNLAIDDKLIVAAQKIGHFKTKREAVTQALTEYINRWKQLRIFELAGKINYYPDYDYKKHRNRG